MRYGEGISLQILYNEVVVVVVVVVVDFVAFLWEGCIDHGWPRIDATITLILNPLIHHVSVSVRKRTRTVPMT